MAWREFEKLAVSNSPSGWIQEKLLRVTVRDVRVPFSHLIVHVCQFFFSYVFVVVARREVVVCSVVRDVMPDVPERETERERGGGPETSWHAAHRARPVTCPSRACKMTFTTSSHPRLSSPARRRSMQQQTISESFAFLRLRALDCRSWPRQRNSTGRAREQRGVSFDSNRHQSNPTP